MKREGSFDFAALERRTLFADVTRIAVEGLIPFPESAVKLGSLVYFIGRTDTAGKEIWSTDGTAGGTRRVTDLVRGAAHGVGGTKLFLAGNSVYFAGSDGKTRKGLWRIDGASGGIDFLNGFSAWDQDLLGTSAVFKGKLFFSYKETLWSTAGTPETTKQIKDLGAIRDDGTPIGMTANNKSVYFWLEDYGGDELWRTDGTAKTTRVVTDKLGYASRLIPFGDMLITTRNEPVTSNYTSELVSIDAANAITLLDGADYDLGTGVTDGSAIYVKRQYRVVDGDAEYDVVRHDSKNRTLLYRPGWNAVEPRAVIGGLMIGIRGTSLVSVDTGGAGAFRIRDFQAAMGAEASVEIVDVTLIGTRAYFALWDGEAAVVPQVWTTDGTAAGTFKLGNIDGANLKFEMPWYVKGVDLNGTQLAFTQNEIYAVRPTTSVNGKVFQDANANRKRDSKEKFLRGGRVFIDLDGDGAYDLGEPTGRSSSSGSYSILDLPAGTYTLRFLPPSGKIATGSAGFQIKVNAGQTLTYSFGAR